jgi:cytochrome c oxidase cbb3-type subunit 4
VSAYQEWSHFAATWGLLYFFALFAIVVAYAYWPRNRKAFEDASMIPMRDDDSVNTPGDRP